MNKIKGKVKNITSGKDVSLVEVDTPIGTVHSVVIGDGSLFEHLQVGKDVYVLFKETEVSIGKDLSGQISLRNRFRCVIKRIEEGQVLSRIILDCGGTEIVSIITTGSVKRMGLENGDNVCALVKTNEVSLMEA